MELLIDHRYPEAETYSGHAEVCTATITIIYSFLGQWIVERMAQQFEEKVITQGGRMLTLRVWQEIEIPEAVGEFPLPAYARVTLEATAAASVLAWMAIVEAVLAALPLIVLAFIAFQVKDIVWSPGVQKVLGGTGDIAKALGEALDRLGGLGPILIVGLIALVLLGRRK